MTTINKGKKICPMMTRPMYYPEEKDVGIYEVECREKRCAWWYKEEGRCAILEIAEYTGVDASQFF